MAHSFIAHHGIPVSEGADQLAVAIQQARLHEPVHQDDAAELEERVAERTRELRAANLQLEEASRHTSEFLATMSHELRSPLNAIIGFTELLREERVGPLNEQQARYLRHVHTCSDHLLQLITDVLDLSKVEAGKLEISPEPLSVAQTLEDILVIARGLAHQKAQEIQTDIPADLPPVSADPLRLKQILFNLLSNAIKFTPEGSTITVRARRVPEQHVPSGISGDCLEIAVTDTGIGIRPEDLSRLFRQFVQLKTTATQQHTGTGLGLALTRKLVELHDGRIWAASEGEGHGSTFTVLLPFTGPPA